MIVPYFNHEKFTLYHNNCFQVLPLLQEASVDLVFADPPYFLSNDGTTCHGGQRVSVNKGEWDESKGLLENYEYTKKWIGECKRVLKPEGTIWISGTSHIIHIVGFCLEELGFKILNDITWHKPNPPPNLACRCFTHATETLIWAVNDPKGRYKFNYAYLKERNGGKQMTSVWVMTAPREDEKLLGKHPTQKPLQLLQRVVTAASDEGDLVLDPFSGSGTTGIAAWRENRRYIGIEREQEYADLSVARFQNELKAASFFDL